MKLPTWTREERTQTMREELPGGTLGGEYTETAVVYRCGDPVEEAFHHRCILAGFNLPEFDQWLAPHPESEGKAALLATRALAKAATGHWELRAHLKDLHANRVHIDRVDYLKPKAARDELRQDPHLCRAAQRGLASGQPQRAGGTDGDEVCLPVATPGG